MKLTVIETKLAGGLLAYLMLTWESHSGLSIIKHRCVTCQTKCSYWQWQIWADLPRNISRVIGPGWDTSTVNSSQYLFWPEFEMIASKCKLLLFAWCNSWSQFPIMLWRETIPVFKGCAKVEWLYRRKQIVFASPILTDMGICTRTDEMLYYIPWKIDKALYNVSPACVLTRYWLIRDQDSL